MKILLTGATGYIGRRLLPALVEQGHFVYCCVRDKQRFQLPSSLEDHTQVIEIDFLKEVPQLPGDIDMAYYLMHSMSAAENYEELELKVASNFIEATKQTSLQQTIYLSGIVNESELSKHLSSRLAVENKLSQGNFALTTLRAGIIIGSGSASFEIIRDLVEKLPIMVTPKWLNTRCQPIGIRDVVQLLILSAGEEKCFNRSFDIGGPDILSYKEMLLGYAKVRGLKRKIYTLPVMTPKLSSYWLYFVTSTSYKLATALVSSMKVEVVCSNNDILKIFNYQPANYTLSLERTQAKIEDNEIVSSWKDAQVSGVINFNVSEFINVPKYGCFRDVKSRKVQNKQDCLEKLWRIGGETGWYYANFLWKLRGFVDQLFGGVGLRRGRRHESDLQVGDALDFWRVLYANKEEGRLLLFAEMKLPGEAWLEFKMKGEQLEQTATFRPKGLAGRLYWYSVLPFHGLIFKNMLKRICA